MELTRRKIVIGMLELCGLEAAAMAGPKRILKSALVGIERFVSPVEISKPEKPSEVCVAQDGTHQQNLALSFFFDCQELKDCEAIYLNLAADGSVIKKRSVMVLK